MWVCITKNIHNTAQNSSDSLIILPLILQTVITARMFCTVRIQWTFIKRCMLIVGARFTGETLYIG